MKEEVAVRKRTQIAKANRAMFLWIAVASALVGTAAVVGVFLTQQLIYNEKVLSVKSTTANTLQSNLDVIDDLKQEVLVLDTNKNLAAAKANPEDQALQVILDALPADANPLALGASLQNKLLTGIPGLQPIETMQIESMEATEETATEAAPTDPTAGDPNAVAVSTNVIGFSVTVSGTQDALKQLLQQLERSIRTIEVSSARFEAQANGEFTLNLTGRAFYEPSRTLELKKEVVER